MNPTMPSSPDLSVVVCTYDRPELLESCLEDLCRQTADPGSYEIIVVDNKPSAATKRAVQRFATLGRVRYREEQRVGLSNARNHGWAVACADYVAYVDDDCRVPQHWVALARRVAKEHQPAVFGGPYFAFYDGPRPAWYRDAYASHVQGDCARTLNDDEFLDGMNIVFRKSVLRELGGFDPNLGMTGSTIAYGEETQLLRRVRQTMPVAKIHYEPELYVHHLVRPEKMTLRWIVRQRFADGRYTHRVFGGGRHASANRVRLLARAAATLGRFGWDAARGALARDRVQYPYAQNFWCECAFIHVHKLGRIVEQYRREATFVGNVGHGAG